MAKPVGSIGAGLRVLMSGAGLFRSAGVRFAIIYAVLLALSAAALALFLWWSTAGLLDRQIDAAIHAKMWSPKYLPYRRTRARPDDRP